jgi:glycosyltransferase involved in cell wall biosynthesis
VIIPCYNYARYLPACVHSALGQRGVEVEALVIDDASTDGSGEVAARLAAADARVTVVRHERNIGHIATYNEGLARATGDYIVLISADDMLTRDALARATAVMEDCPEVGLVYGHPQVFSGSDVTPARIGGIGLSVWSGPNWISAQCQRGTSCIYSPEACVRASVHRAAGDYNPALPHTGDLEMWLRVAALAAVARVNSTQAYKRVHGRNMIQTSYGDLLADLRGRHDAYRWFFHGPGSRLPRAARDLGVARRRLAEEALDHVCSQLRADADGSAGVVEYVSFAREMQGPELVRLRGWREYRWLCGDGGLPSSLIAARLGWGSLLRDVERRYRWYRWRLTGV